MRRHLLSANDVSADDLVWVVGRARDLASGPWPAPVGPSPVLGSLFLEPSLRTRVGFSTAAARLGWSTVAATSLRSSPSSIPESFEDTLRVVAGYCDVVVARVGQALQGIDLSAYPAAVVNGGDIGPAAEHPTQALIDIAAMQAVGVVGQLSVLVVGDPRMRVVRSLLGVLRHCPPRHLAVAGIDEYSGQLTDASSSHLHGVPAADLSAAAEVDVLYVAGMPHRSLPLAVRERLIVTADVLATMAPDAVVLSPMPVIDEVHPEVRQDPRFRVHQQSDYGLFVRAAILERWGREVAVG